MLCKILWSWWAIPTPRPFCNDKLSNEARNNISLQRDCSCFRIDDIKTLIDCPETIWNSANKAGLNDINNLFITHWHPDHTFWLRLVLESRFDFFKDTVTTPINLYLHKNIYEDIKNFYPSIDYLVNGIKCANLIFFEDNEEIKIDNISITPIGYKNVEPHRFWYLIQEKYKSIFYLPCDTIWYEKELPQVDILIHECWILAKDVTTELSFDELINRIRKSQPWKTILTHIEEIELENFWDQLKWLINDNKNLNISLAHDSMDIKI